MGIVDNARRDVGHFLTDSGKGFAIDVTLDDGTETADIQATATKHHLKTDQEGLPANSRVASVTVHLDHIANTNASYSVRNDKGEIDFLRHLVTFLDSHGESETYVVREQFPDEYLGLVVLKLGLYSP